MTITNLTDQTPRLSVSTWSLHRVLGESDFYGPREWKKNTRHNGRKRNLASGPTRSHRSLWHPHLGNLPLPPAQPR